MIGVTVNLWLGGAGLVIAFSLIGYALWHWGRTSRWPLFLRLVVLVVAAGLPLAYSGRQIILESRNSGGQLPAPNSGRFIRVHPHDLMGLVSKTPPDFTGILAGKYQQDQRAQENDRIFSAYLGKWWAIESEVSNIERQHADGGGTAGFGKPSGAAPWTLPMNSLLLPYFYCQFDPRFADALLGYKVGDAVRVVGQVMSIDTTVFMQHCEIVTGKSELTFYRIPK